MGETQSPHGADAPSDPARTAFKEFYRNQFSKIVGMIMLAGGERVEAEDATQQAMLAAYQNWSKINHPRGWVRKAAKNHFLKTRQRDRDHLNKAIEGGASTPPSQEPLEMTAWEDQQWVNALLDELTPAQREIFECLMNGLNNTEIAELLGKTSATVRKNLQLARDRLRARLDLITLEVARVPDTPGGT